MNHITETSTVQKSNIIYDSIRWGQNNLKAFCKSYMPGFNQNNIVVTRGQDFNGNIRSDPPDKNQYQNVLKHNWNIRMINATDLKVYIGENRCKTNPGLNNEFLTNSRGSVITGKEDEAGHNLTNKFFCYLGEHPQRCRIIGICLLCLPQILRRQKIKKFI